MSAKSVVETYVRAWHERDESTRRKLLEESWAADGVYTDPRVTVESREALVAHIAWFHEVRPDVRIEVRSDIDEHGRFFRFAFATVDPTGTVLLEGVDFGQLDADGRIASITAFFGPLPASR